MAEVITDQEWLVVMAAAEPEVLQVAEHKLFKQPTVQRIVEEAAAELRLVQVAQEVLVL